MSSRGSSVVPYCRLTATDFGITDPACDQRRRRHHCLSSFMVVNRRRSSFFDRRCSYLERFAVSCHVRTISASLLWPLAACACKMTLLLLDTLIDHAAYLHVLTRNCLRNGTETRNDRAAVEQRSAKT